MPSNHPSQSHFSLDPWQLSETRFDVAENYLAETLFALGNGMIGLRGTQDETYTGPPGTSHEGNYLNGFYESEPIEYPEAAFGLAQNNQFMLNLPSAKRLDLRIDGEPFDLLTGQVLDYQRTLDFRDGVLRRSVTWQSPKGHQIRVNSERLVSFERRHLFAVRYQIEAINWSGTVQLHSTIDAEAKNLVGDADPRVSSRAQGGALVLQQTLHDVQWLALVHRTHRSNLELITAVMHDATGWTLVSSSSASVQNYSRHIIAGEKVTLVKFGCYLSSRDVASVDLQQSAKAILLQGKTDGFDQLYQEQKQYLAQYWSLASVDIDGPADLAQGMHFNQFHLLQSVGRDGKTNIAAKGLSGEGYEGHYFWDTEIYVLPFFLYNKPEIARQLLTFRYRGLDQARQRARQMAHPKGALYPWRTIAGEECSAYFPAGTAQYHINADIAYAVKLYVDATDDVQFLIDCGAEMVLDTARIWLGIGHFSTRGTECFCINEVTGPDEYTALVNNNYYTNLMAQLHLEFALSVARRLSAGHPEHWRRIVKAIDLADAELVEWERAARLMYLPYDDDLAIHAQDDSFLSKKVWDFAGTPEQNYPLLLHYHPLVIYRHQVCKQADLLLAMLLQSDKFTLEQKRRNFDYYEKVTTHDSSLSSCIFSIIASEIGDHDKAYEYFMETVRLDLDDTHNNTCHGVHTAAMAGSWMCVTYGFAGMRVLDGNVHFNPSLPAQWKQYRVNVQIKGALLEVTVTRQRVSYRVVNDQSLRLCHDGREFLLTGQQVQHFTTGATP